MKKTNIIHFVAGTFVLTGLLLAHYVNPNWLWLCAFVGANLLQSSLTKWCLLERILARMGYKDDCGCQ